MSVRDRLNRARARLALPLFVKELTEAAARRRTYVVRTVYAGSLFLLAILFARDVLFPTGDAFAVLGRGGELYAIVMLIQFGGVYLFLPALTAASITAEKERNTLGLLLLTKLSPTKIVLEKYLGRVFPMLCLTLLSLPLLGVAYTLGGLELSLLFEGVLRLAVTILMIGAIGVACSAWCRTTAGAFISTYAIVLALFPGLPVIAEEFGLFRPYGGGLAQGIAKVGVDLRLWSEERDSIFLFFGAYPVIRWMDTRSLNAAGLPTAFLARPAWVVLLQTLPLLVPTIASLVAARLVLVPRAEVKPKRYLARAFVALDRSFREWNDRYAKGIEVIKTRGTLPDYAPVAWRETTKTTLGSFRYLVRMLLLVEVPVLFIGLLGAGSSDQFGSGLLTMVAALLWLGAGLLVASKAAGLFPGERARQSLDVLLATPMPSRQIVREKLAGVWRLILVSAVPLMSTFGLIAYLRFSVNGTFGHYGVIYVMLAASVTITHLALTAYLSLLVGLRLPTQSRAVLLSITILTVLCLAGPITQLVTEAGRGRFYYNGDEPSAALSLYSPASVLGEMLATPNNPERFTILLFGNTILYGGLALTLRWLCYRSAGEWLGRDENEPPPPILEGLGAKRTTPAAYPAETADMTQPAEAIG